MNYDREVHNLVQLWTHSKDSPERRQVVERVRGLRDLGYFKALREALSATTHDGERESIYWMLGSLLRRTADRSVGEFLMERVGVERKKRDKTEILLDIGAARGKGVGIRDASNALDCLSEKMKILRRAAVKSLGSCADPRAEDALADLVERSISGEIKESGWHLYHALRSLSEVATPKSVPTILRVIERIDEMRLGTRKRDIKAMAVKALGKIAPVEHRGVFVELVAKDKAPLVKWHAMRVLAQIATADDKPLLKRRVRSIVNGKRVPKTEPPLLCPDVSDLLLRLSEGDEAKTTELLFAFAALTRLLALEDPSLCATLRSKWSNLTPSEQAYLKNATGAFSDLSVHGHVERSDQPG